MNTIEPSRAMHANAEPGSPQDLFYSPQAERRPIYERGQGMYLWDDKGNQFLDGCSGPVTCNLGYGNSRIIEAMHQQAEALPFSFASTARNHPNLSYSQRLTELAGAGFERALLVSGGSEAVDMAIKFCRQYRYATGERQRSLLISCRPAYHGMTLGALSVCGDPAFESIFGDMIGMSEKIPAALSYRRPDLLSEQDYELNCAGKLEETILKLGADRVLAFIVEPVGGSASGANAPTAVYFNEIRRICDAYGLFLIYDEVMSGAGRSGHFLTSHRWPHAKPDISVLAKGLGAGYSPLGAMLTSAELVDELAELSGFNYAHTYNANPLSCAVGNAVLDEIIEHRLLQNCQTMGQYLRGRLGALQSDSALIGEIRGRGLLLGIELVADKQTRTSLPVELNAGDRLVALARKQGLLLYSRRSCAGAYGDNVLIAPPLIVGRQEIDQLVDLLSQALAGFEHELRSDGHLT